MSDFLRAVNEALALDTTGPMHGLKPPGGLLWCEPPEAADLPVSSARYTMSRLLVTCPACIEAMPPARIIVCGSRHARRSHSVTIQHNMAGFPRGSIITHGWADGVDSLADGLANYLGYRVERWPVDWTAARRILGERWRLAGPLRNAWMFHAAPTDLVLAFPMPGSKGTRDMIKQARAAGVPVRVVELQP